MQEENKVPYSDIEKAVTEAFNTPGAVLCIKGYTSSSGSVTDYKVKYIKKEGYLRLVQESIQALNDGIYYNDEHDKEVWDKAEAELKASWQRTLNGEHPSRNFKKTEPDPALIVITHLEAVDIFEQEPPSKVTLSRPLTLAKEDIMLQVPLGNYVGKLNLRPSSIKSISVEYNDEGTTTAGAGTGSPAEVPQP